MMKIDRLICISESHSQSRGRGGAGGGGVKGQGRVKTFFFFFCNFIGGFQCVANQFKTMQISNNQYKCNLKKK